MEGRDIAGMKNAHKVLAEYTYDPVEIKKGYAGRTLRIDLGSGSIKEAPVTDEMKELWTGGKGFDLWMMLQEVSGETKWDSPENPISFSSGPLGGTTSFPGAGKTLVTAVSPTTGSVIDCNVGGYFGPYLKFSGYDALSIIGKADEEVVIYVDGPNRRITIESAPEESIDSHVLAEELTEMYADDEADRRNIAVVSAGRGAQHSRLGVLNFSFYDWRRRIPRLKQAGRGGIGSVLRDKRVKAMVIKNSEISPEWEIEDSKASSFFDIPEPCHDCQKDEAADTIKVIKKWNSDPEYVIEMMQDIQAEKRQISRVAIDTISREAGVSAARLYQIATFYKAFSLAKRGETLVQVCVGTACHVKGSGRILEELERVMAVERGGTTKDGKYSLEAVACLGCCSIAPAIKIGEDVIGNLQVKDVAGILEEKQRGENV